MIPDEVKRGLRRFILLLGVYVAGMIVGELNTWAGSILIGMPIGALLGVMAADLEWFGPRAPRIRRSVAPRRAGDVRRGPNGELSPPRTGSIPQSADRTTVRSPDPTIQRTGASRPAEIS